MKSTTDIKLIDKGCYRILIDDDGGIIVELLRRRNGSRLKKPVRASFTRQPTKGNLAILDYVCRSLALRVPRALPLVLRNESVWRLARHFYTYKTQSLATLWTYVWRLQRWCRWMSLEPDEIVKELRVGGREVEERLRSRVEDFLAELRGLGLSTSTVASFHKTIKTFLTVNGLELRLPEKPPETPENRDRAPTPEELAKVLEIASLREKVIVSILALSGLRIGTLAKLRYKHVRKDLERGVTPIHIHVDVKITKGKYADYDTFVGAEGAEYLKLYIEQQMRGTEKIPPEELADDSPLIRAYSRDVKPLLEDQISHVIRRLFRRAGFSEKVGGRRYELRAHSLRKFFKTQMTARGVPSEYVEYMMGHVISTYNDVKSLGVERLRQIYASANLSIKPQKREDIYDLIEDLLREKGYLVDRDLLVQAISRAPKAGPHKTLIVGNAEEERKRYLRQRFLDLLKRELEIDRILESTPR